MKDFILILILCFLASLKVTLQGQVAKKDKNNFFSATAFNGIIFIAAAVLFSFWLASCSIQTVFFGAVFGILTVLFQICYFLAMSCGNVSLTVMIVNFSMIFPIIYSFYAFSEQIATIKFVGIALVSVSLLLSLNKNGSGRGDFKKWLLLSLCAAAANGGLAICQKIFGATEYNSENKSFVSWAYLTAAVLSFILCLVFYKKLGSFKLSVKPVLFGASAGAVLAVFQCLNTYAVSVINSATLFPAYNGGSMVLSAFSGVIILKDKLTKKQILSVLLGITAVIILTVQ